MTRLLSDDDIRSRLTPEMAVDGVRRALVDAHRGGARRAAARTGALGAAAVDALARADAEVVGIVGSGRQAWTQVWAATAVRAVAQVRVFSPTEAHRERSPSGRGWSWDSTHMVCRRPVTPWTAPTS
jgi:ornithine cyclodeaminase/alanine dehydrogenase-like protein (mu-crystallin family)